MEINLTSLPNLSVLKNLSYEEYTKSLMERIEPLLDASVSYETSSEKMLAEALAYVLTLRDAEINQRFKDLMPIYAKGDNLDVACMNNYGTTRLEEESDEAFLQRSLYSLQQSNTAGSEWSYYYHTYNVDAHITSVNAFRSNAGEVTIVYYAYFSEAELKAKLNIESEILSTEQTLLINTLRDELLNRLKEGVKEVLNDPKIRPLNELQVVKQATPIEYTIEATIKTKSNINAEIAKQEAFDATERFVNTLKIGEEIKRSKLIALLHANGVGEVILDEPSSNIIVDSESVAICTGVTITQEVETDE